MLPYQNLSLEDMPGEVWKDISGFEGFYLISNYGRAKTIAHTTTDHRGSKHYVKERILVQNFSGQKRSYLGFSSHKKGQTGRIYIHKAVAVAFIPNPYNKPCIDHINTITADNHVDNLRWVTHSENLKNPITSKRISKAKSGPNCSFYGKRLRAKPVVCIHPDGTRQHFSSLFDAQQAGFCSRSIYCCIRGIYSHHKGCKWEFDL